MLKIISKKMSTKLSMSPSKFLFRFPVSPTATAAWHVTIYAFFISRVLNLSRDISVSQQSAIGNPKSLNPSSLIAFFNS